MLYRVAATVSYPAAATEVVGVVEVTQCFHNHGIDTAKINKKVESRKSKVFIIN
jgi:hypothetical protein